MYSCITEVLFFAIWGHVFCMILVQSDGLLKFLPNWIEKAITLGKHNAMQNYDRNYFQYCVHAYYTCGKCHAGLIATIYFPFAYSLFDFINWFVYVVMTIFTGYTLEKLYDT